MRIVHACLRDPDFSDKSNTLERMTLYIAIFWWKAAAAIFSIWGRMLELT